MKLDINFLLYFLSITFLLFTANILLKNLKKWKCTENRCEKVFGGDYDNLSQCQNVCNKQKNNNTYDCVNNVCQKSEHNGKYTDPNCNNECARIIKQMVPVPIYKPIIYGFPMYRRRHRKRHRRSKKK